jgi:hypothetical protein
VSSFESTPARFGAADAVAGVMAAASIALSLIALAERPARLAPIAVVVALVAARMSSRFERLAYSALVIAMVSWVVGMTIAVVTENALI